nr:MAG TPA: hypothetical protein [Herelleviridae sp.]
MTNPYKKWYNRVGDLFFIYNYYMIVYNLIQKLYNCI